MYYMAIYTEFRVRVIVFENSFGKIVIIKEIAS
jgi:hypothetical protein